MQHQVGQYAAQLLHDLLRDLLAPFSSTWLGSYRLPKGQGALPRWSLFAVIPVSLIDVDDLIARLTQVSEQVSRALALMLGLVTVAALLVLLTQTQASMAQRRRELLLMRTLGASSELLKKMLRWELVASGALAGLCAAMVVELCSLLACSGGGSRGCGSSTGPSGSACRRWGHCW